MKNSSRVFLRCRICQELKEGIKLKSYNLKICHDCFLTFFRRRVQNTVAKFRMFKKDDNILVAVSGGKDSVALAKVLKDLGYRITLFHVNCRITEDNYSEISQKKVEELAEREDLPLKIYSFEKEFPVDIKLAAKISRREICAVCGMIKRYILNRETKDFDVICTGHTLNDEAANLLSSFIFWNDFFVRQYPVLEEKGSLKKRAKPLTFTFEQETKLFCEILALPYNPNPCPLVGGSYLFFKKIVNEIESEMPSAIINFYKGFLKRKKSLGLIKRAEEIKLEPCERCGYLTVAKLCNFCRLHEKIQKYLGTLHQ
ncbi:MAG: adenine nucleotide alpha hydrolase family protein [candidate division WOR-3 bacterium]|nr:adenine nucleotide alpha hydrolase family protein [candidate division WOR-3 bacterium]MCX7757947.1 adenine nucleotide alpha hydrolase family protein [candidate division WOR-3 bacterium]MDW7987294.1 ATP-binding protein [candidate division WOR-3 bacterium]